MLITRFQLMIIFFKKVFYDQNPTFSYNYNSTYYICCVYKTNMI